MGTGYLYSAATKRDNHNYLRTGTNKYNNAKASITLSSNSSATIVFDNYYSNNGSRNNLKFNTSEILFSCYAPSSLGVTNVKLYRKVKTLPGDADGNGRVDIMDVFVMANKLMDQSVENFVFENADLLPDKAITITDLMGVVDIILRKTGE